MEQTVDQAASTVLWRLSLSGGEGRAEPEGKALCLPVSQRSTTHFSQALVYDQQDRNMNTDWKEFPSYAGWAQPLR